MYIKNRWGQDRYACAPSISDPHDHKLKCGNIVQACFRELHSLCHGVTGETKFIHNHVVSFVFMVRLFHQTYWKSWWNPSLSFPLYLRHTSSRRKLNTYVRIILCMKYYVIHILYVYVGQTRRLSHDRKKLLQLMVSLWFKKRKEKIRIVSLNYPTMRKSETGHLMMI